MMELTENQKETLKMSGIGIIAVTLSGIIAHFLAPENQTGQLIKFFTPLTAALLIGAKIYFKQLKILNQKIESNNR